MKRIRQLLLIISVFISTVMPMSVIADDGGTYEVPTKKLNDPEPSNDPPKGIIPNRLPSSPVIITITDGEGVSIPGVDNDDVISFSIYNEDGMLIAMYDDDMDFASAVFSMTGVIEIRIALDGYSLCGWMEL